MMAGEASCMSGTIRGSSTSRSSSDERSGEQPDYFLAPPGEVVPPHGRKVVEVADAEATRGGAPGGRLWVWDRWSAVRAGSDSRSQCGRCRRVCRSAG